MHCGHKNDNFTSIWLPQGRIVDLEEMRKHEARKKAVGWPVITSWNIRWRIFCKHWGACGNTSISIQLSLSFEMDAESHLSQQFQTAFAKRNPVYHLQHPQQCLLQETANAVLKNKQPPAGEYSLIWSMRCITFWGCTMLRESSMIYFALNTLQLAVDTDVTSQHISCTSICPSLLRGSLPRQLRVKVRDHIVHNSTALHLHSRLERQETCNSWKTRKHAPPRLFQQSVCWKMNGMTSKRPCVELCVEILEIL